MFKSDILLVQAVIGSSFFRERNAKLNYNMIVNKVLFLLRQVFGYYTKTH